MDQGFMKLEAWRKADDLASEVFRLTEKEMHSRHRWLALQLVRAAFSVTANISEGYGRSSLGDYLRFLEFAGGSLNEVENALHFIKRNKVLPSPTLEHAEELRRATGNLLFGLMRSLRRKLENKESWQRGLIREPSIDYDASIPSSEFPIPSSEFPVPSSTVQFPVPSSHFPVPSSQFPDTEAPNA